MSYFNGKRGDWHFQAKAAIYDPVKGHTGEDYLMPVGTPITSPVNGKVVMVRTQTEMGECMYIQEANTNYVHVFAHLSKELVKIGQEVKRGDQIALSGHTGTEAGAVPHLHYEIIAPAPWPDYKGMSRTLSPFVGFNIPPEEYLGILQSKEVPEWQKNGADWLVAHKLITTGRIGNEPVSIGELGVILQRFQDSLKK